MECSKDGVRSLFYELASSICKDAQSKRVRARGYIAVLCPRRALLGAETAECQQFAINGLRTAFDVVLLRRSSWYPRYRKLLREGMSPASRCYGEAYCLKAGGRCEEGTRLDRLLMQLEGNELLAEAASSLLHVLWRLRRPAPLDHSYWTKSRVLPQYLPLDSMSASVDMLAWQSELFTCQPGSGFKGLFSLEAGEQGQPVASTLFGGLTHAKTSSLNATLGLPPLTSDSSFLLPLGKAGEKVCHGDKAAMNVSHTSEHDSGVDLLEGELSVWSEVDLQRQPAPPTWDIEHSERRYLTEAGPTAFDHAHELYIDNLYRFASLPPPASVQADLVVDTLYALQGAASLSYELREESAELRAVAGLHSSGTGHQATTPLLSFFARMGTLYIRLSHFSLLVEEHGCVARGLAASLRAFLQLYQGSVVQAAASGQCNTLLSIKHLLKDVLEALKYLGQFCGVGGAWPPDMGCFPKGMALLDRLYVEALEAQGGCHLPLMLALLRSTLRPYVIFIQRWVFGGVCCDPDEDFAIKADPAALNARDKTYWSEGYTLSREEQCVPAFVAPALAQHIFTCGKALNLLKLCSPQHYILDPSIKPPLFGVVFAQEALEDIERNCSEYQSVMSLRHAVWVGQRRKEKERRRDALLASAVRERRMLMEAAAKAKREREEEEAREVEGKRAELERLRLQMEFDRQRRALAVDEEKAADRERLHAALAEEGAQGEMERQLKEEARQELVEYYSRLSQEAEFRQLRALWRQRRLELGDRRRAYLKEEVERMGQELEQWNRSKENPTAQGEASDRPRAPSDLIVAATLPAAGSREDGLVSELGDQTTPQADGGATLQTDDGTTVQTDGGTTLQTDDGTTLRTDDGTTVQTDDGTTAQTDDGTTLRTDDGTTPQADGGATVQTDDGTTAQTDDGTTVQTDDGTTAQTDDGTTLRTDDGTTVQTDDGTTVQTDDGTTLQTDDGTTVKTDDGTTLQADNVTTVQTDDGTAVQTDDGTTLRTDDGTTVQTDDGTAVQADDGTAVQTDSGVIPPPTELTEETATRQRSEAGEVVPGVDCQTATLSLSVPRPSPPPHQLPAVAEGGIEAMVARKESPPGGRGVSTRGGPPPTTIQQILYPGPREAAPLEVVKGSRGQEPPSTAQYLLYPERGWSSVPMTMRYIRSGQEESDVVKEVWPAPPTSEGVWLDCSVEPYRLEYDHLDLPPQMDKMYVVGGVSLSHDRSENDSAPEAIHPLPTLLEKCIVLPLKTQASAVNSALVSYFLEELAIQEHFVAMRRFLLLEDGEFGHTLANALFEAVSSPSAVVRLSSAAFLNPLLTTALQSSIYGDTPHSSRLGFALKYQPAVIRTSSVHVLDFLELHYSVEWPCNVVITASTIAKSNQILHFLLQLKRTSWALQDVFAHLKKREDSHHTRSPEETRELLTVRHEMQHFVTVLQGYMAHQVLHVTWEEFQRTLQTNVHSLDDLCHCHSEYINQAIFRSLLSKKASAVMKIILEIFQCVHKYRLQVTAGRWQSDVAALTAIRATHRSFREKTRFLFIVVTKLVQRGYQSHLEDFALRLNYNGFYAAA